ncbi:hydroxyacid oxidoreductase [Advenella sp. S44]|uniref:NAD(P)-dependent oxidoreductase n=1 Tax=Advenella sp. S44 TaxID=1982755 RepID=UPI000C2A78DC|nr:NAD(P)-dependent oxidoreductase [Advenella sp. S44]PJX25636.1 hydroxyacid oxidoreductase [Advenella sp. S44]
MNPADQKIGFIGVGSMGYPMASRLQQAGYPLLVMDTNAQLTEPLARLSSVTVAATGYEMARECNFIITMLPTSAIVETVLTGANGVLAALNPNTVIIDMSSGIPTQTLRLAKLTQEAGGALIDAPVSGGVARARTGELAIMAGGADDIIQRVRPILSVMGKTISHTGDVGSAHAMKALNNLVSAGGFLIGVEALLIGQRFGLDPSVMIDILNASTGMNNSTQKKFKQFVLSRKFDSGFGLDLMIKDLTIATGLAAESATPAPFSALCREMWASAAGLLGPGQDHTALAKLLENLSQTELGDGKP